MKITKHHVTKLINLIDQGLVLGGGSFTSKGDFCVQQAVDNAVHGYQSDHPACIHYEVINFGIQLNDTFVGSMKTRAEILKRFAVAELGSVDLKISNFLEQVKIRVLKKTGKMTDIRHDTVGIFADAAVDVLTELGSPGVKYLYMCDPGAQLKPEHQEALKKEQELQKKLRNMIEWKGFGKQQTTGGIKAKSQ